MEIKKLVTHNGSFHADDIFATACLLILLEKRGEKYEIIRTRDEEIIKNGDFVYDVGGVYDPEKNRFDHHQKGGAGKRENGIEYSSVGLIWSKYGEEMTGSKEAMRLVDKHLICPIDASDNGFDLVESKHEIFPYFIQDFLRAMRPSWREDYSKNDEMFFDAVEIAKKNLVREIIYAQDSVIADEAIWSIYQNTQDKRIIVLDKNYAKKEILQKLQESIFVIFPREVDNSWGVEAIRKDFKSFGNKKNLPASWGGLRDEELQKITGVPDALFCHKELFFAVAKSKEGAIKLAELALLV